jgi:glycosyltransferase involved in cell wall biosynthesis
MTTPPTSSAAARDLPDRGPITARYLMLTFIPYYRDARGDVWLGRLWHRDFVEHLRYLKNITLAAPEQSLAEEPRDVVKVELPPDVALRLAPLPPMRSTAEALARLPALTMVLWRAIGDAEIVHSGIAGWPIPPGWVASPIALVRKRMLLMIVESAPWRVSAMAQETTARARIREVVTEALARFFVQRADVKVFTQPEYQRTLAPGASRGCHVTPASWINDEDIVSHADARASWAAKRGAPVRLLFAARLIPAKGVDVLLEALRELDRDGARARVHVIGEGPKRDECVRAANELRTVEVRVLDPVPYGAPFFSLVREHHAVLVPNLGDEQPRMIFDAYAQAVPVIASDTDGLRPHVKDGETGWLVQSGSADDLAGAIRRAVGAPSELERMGMRCLAEAPRFTHRAMHGERWRILDEALSRWAGPKSAA